MAHLLDGRRRHWPWVAVLEGQGHLPPSRVGQHVAIGMATERSATTRLKDSTLKALEKRFFWENLSI